MGFMGTNKKVNAPLLYLPLGTVIPCPVFYLFYTEEHLQCVLITKPLYIRKKANKYCGFSK